MANRSRDKGTMGETAVVDYLHARGHLGVERHALHGNRDVGDINGMPGLALSVKRPGAGKPIALSKWLHDLDSMMVNATRPGLVPVEGVLVVRRVGYPDPARWYAIQEFGHWLDHWESP